MSCRDPTLFCVEEVCGVRPSARQNSSDARRAQAGRLSPGSLGKFSKLPMNSRVRSRDSTSPVEIFGVSAVRREPAREDFFLEEAGEPFGELLLLCFIDDLFCRARKVADDGIRALEWLNSACNSRIMVLPSSVQSRLESFPLEPLANAGDVFG